MSREGVFVDPIIKNGLMTNINTVILSYLTFYKMGNILRKIYIVMMY